MENEKDIDAVDIYCSVTAIDKVLASINGRLTQNCFQGVPTTIKKDILNVLHSIERHTKTLANNLECDKLKKSSKAWEDEKYGN